MSYNDPDFMEGTFELYKFKDGIKALLEMFFNDGRAEMKSLDSLASIKSAMRATKSSSVMVRIILVRQSWRPSRQTQSAASNRNRIYHLRCRHLRMKTRPLQTAAISGPRSVLCKVQPTKYGEAVRQSRDGLYLAGSDYANGWSGFIDGAIENGSSIGERSMSAITSLIKFPNKS